jgi:hypothetical protein
MTTFRTSPCIGEGNAIHGKSRDFRSFQRNWDNVTYPTSTVSLSPLSRIPAPDNRTQPQITSDNPTQRRTLDEALNKTAKTTPDGLPPNSIGQANTPRGDRPSKLLAALNCDAVIEALDAAALRCVRTALATFARQSDPSEGRRHRWHRQEIEHQLAKLPCDPVLLRPIVERIMPAQRRIKKAKGDTIARRWSTIESSVRRVLQPTD